MKSCGPSPPETARDSLQGLGILVTRPARQAHRLCDLISAAGGNPIAFPAMEIGPLPDKSAVQLVVQGLNRCALAIFVSPNAVRYGIEIVRASGGFPKGIELVAVGNATAAALQAAGHPPSLVPLGRSDSEALLATDRLHRVEGERILIFRGQGGRALLGDTLSARGANVSYAEVYRRLLPAANVDDLVASWGKIDLVVATSQELLDNLIRLFGETYRALLCAKPLVVISERLRTHAHALGFQQVILAARASDDAIVHAIVRFKHNT